MTLEQFLELFKDKAIDDIFYDKNIEYDPIYTFIRSNDDDNDTIHCLITISLLPFIKNPITSYDIYLYLELKTTRKDMPYFNDNFEEQYEVIHIRYKILLERTYNVYDNSLGKEKLLNFFNYKPPYIICGSSNESINETLKFVDILLYIVKQIILEATDILQEANDKQLEGKYTHDSKTYLMAQKIINEAIEVYKKTIDQGLSEISPQHKIQISNQNPINIIITTTMNYNLFITAIFSQQYIKLENVTVILIVGENKTVVDTTYVALTSTDDIYQLIQTLNEIIKQIKHFLKD